MSKPRRPRDSRRFRTPEAGCPHCRQVLDALANPLSLHSPSPGDLSVCLVCGGLLELNADLTVKALDAATLLVVQREDPAAYAQLLRMSAQARALHSQSKPTQGAKDV